MRSARGRAACWKRRGLRFSEQREAVLSAVPRLSVTEAYGVAMSEIAAGSFAGRRRHELSALQHCHRNHRNCANRSGISSQTSKSCDCDFVDVANDHASMVRKPARQARAGSFAFERPALRQSLSKSPTRRGEIQQEMGTSSRV
jgi:hypothetical protein